MDKTRAKFRCQRVDEMSYAPSVPKGVEPEPVKKYAKTAHLYPVYAKPGEVGENAVFYTASPSGSFALQIDNSIVWGFFEKDAEYYFDISKAPPA